MDLEKLRKRYRVKTIIDFTLSNHATERERSRQLGMEHINIRWDVDTWMTWFYDYNRVEKKFMSIMEDPSKYPIYVHCVSGRDRTGTMVAVYRMKKQGWTFDGAFSEMKRYGFDEKQYPNLVTYLKKVDKSRQPSKIRLKPIEIPATVKRFFQRKRVET